MAFDAFGANLAPIWGPGGALLEATCPQKIDRKSTEIAFEKNPVSVDFLSIFLVPFGTRGAQKCPGGGAQMSYVDSFSCRCGPWAPLGRLFGGPLRHLARSQLPNVS